MVQDFEKSVLKFTKSKFATAVNSATSALHLACLALEVRQGDWVWTSPNTFVSALIVEYIVEPKSTLLI